jgi:hypothetical protein
MAAMIPRAERAGLESGHGGMMQVGTRDIVDTKVVIRASIARVRD